MNNSRTISSAPSNSKDHGVDQAKIHISSETLKAVQYFCAEHEKLVKNPSFRSLDIVTIESNDNLHAHVAVFRFAPPDESTGSELHT